MSDIDKILTLLERITKTLESMRADSEERSARLKTTCSESCSEWHGGCRFTFEEVPIAQRVPHLCPRYKVMNTTVCVRCMQGLHGGRDGQDRCSNEKCVCYCRKAPQEQWYAGKPGEERRSTIPPICDRCALYPEHKCAPTTDTTCGMFQPKAVPTHRCTVCGALWLRHEDGSWSLTSATCGKCCDNSPDFTKVIVPLRSW